MNIEIKIRLTFNITIRTSDVNTEARDTEALFSRQVMTFICISRATQHETAQQISIDVVRKLTQKE